MMHPRINHKKIPRKQEKDPFPDDKNAAVAE